MLECPQCESSSVVHDKTQGEKVCTRCGLVLLEKEMSSKPEWHEEPGQEKGRADLSSGSDITQHDLGLGSKMGDSNDLSPAWKSKLRRLKKWHRRARASNYQEKSLRQGLINLDKLCEDLFLPKSVKAEVSVLFRKAKEDEITPGRNTWSVLAALIFMVARMRQIPRTEKEVAKALSERTDLERKESRKALRRNRKVLARELDMDVPRPRPKEYLDRFASQLDLSKKVRARAHEMSSSIPEKFKSRKASFLVAASILYNAAQEFDGNLNIRDVADELEVGASSVSTTGKRVREFLSDQGE